MRITWPRKRRTETAPADLSTGDDAARAIDRARSSRAQAARYLETAQQQNHYVRSQLRVNHLAEDVYATMRRKRS